MPVSLGQRSILNPLSWNLTIDSIVIAVTGSMSIGTLMVQLVNCLGSLNLLFSEVELLTSVESFNGKYSVLIERLSETIRIDPR
jgi:hypothetical protein